ncbi:MAG: hypothetical protein WCG06_00750 [Candidatus Omnitrophota bacterium]
MTLPLLKNECEHLLERLTRFHKALLDFQMRQAQAMDGRRYGPYEALNLLLQDKRFLWLRTLSQLIAGIEERLADDAKNKSKLDLRALLKDVNGLFNGQLKQFAAGYQAALTLDPQLAIEEVEVKKAASALTPFVGG